MNTTKWEKQKIADAHEHEINEDDDLLSHIIEQCGILPCSWVRCSAAVNTNHKHICQSHQPVPLNDSRVSLNIITNQSALHSQLNFDYLITNCFTWELYIIGLTVIWPPSHTGLCCVYIFCCTLAPSMVDKCFVW